ncbi:MAG: TolC family protein [Candidatus Krumholzibacteriota bacterium]
MYRVRAANIRQTPFFTLSMMIPAVLAVLLLLVLPARAQDSAPVGGDLPVLSLQQCIRIALEDSPRLLVEDQRRHIASQDVTGAWGQFLPTITLGYNWNKGELKEFDVPQMDGTTADQTAFTKTKRLNGQTSLNVFRGFSKFSRLSSARNQLRSAEANRDYTRELVVEDVTAAYFNLMRFQRLLAVALETREQVALELERTETYFRLGSAAKSDVLQQRVQLENTKLEVVIADNNVNNAFADLAFLMNHPLAEGFEVDATILDTEYTIPPVGDLYQEALANRLDILSSEHNLEARHKDVTTATATAWPSVDLFAQHDRADADTPYRFGSQKSANTYFGWSASWNVFDRLQTWTGRSQAKANARIAEYELQQAKLNVQVEIRQLHNSMVEARERAHVSEETIIQSEEELRLASERFRVGAGTTLDIIVAQANLANSRASEVQAMCDFLIAETRLNRALGRATSRGGGVQQ